MTTFGGLTQLRQEITPVLHERMNTPTSSTENKNVGLTFAPCVLLSYLLKLALHLMTISPY